MKNRRLRALAASFVLFGLASCGGGESPGGLQGAVGSTIGGSGEAALSGSAVNSATGAVASGVDVTATADSQLTTTDGQGTFSFASATAGDQLVLFQSSAFARQARRVTVVSGVPVSLRVQLVPVGVATPSPFDPTTVQTLTVAGSVAQVDLPANGLVVAGGGVPTGQVTARLTPISVAQESELLPGDYTLSTASGRFESFGGLEVVFTDSAGNALNLGAAQTATIRIPVGTRSTSPPATVDLMHFNTTTGLWVQEGTATLAGTPPNLYYEGTVTHFTHWAAGAAYTVSNITVCVRDEAGAIEASARVIADGISYSGNATALTNAQGVAVVPMKRGGEATIASALGTRNSNTTSISAAQSAADFTLATCLTLPAPNAGLAVKLTWGQSPSDLDSHLLGPNGTHVYYVTRGDLLQQPFASLDVDDVTGSGPEVVTISRLAKGAYRYFVHNFSQSFGPGQTDSPARIEVRFGALTQLHTPPAGEGTNLYWHVFDFTVSNDCTVVITPVNAWSATEPANPSEGISADYCEAVGGAGTVVPPIPLVPPQILGGEPSGDVPLPGQ